MSPDLSMRVCCPIASSLVYPVILVKAGFTYWMIPLRSVITTPSAACSTAIARSACATASLFRNKVHLERRFRMFFWLIGHFLDFSLRGAWNMGEWRGASERPGDAGQGNTKAQPHHLPDTPGWVKGPTLVRALRKQLDSR